jgi:DNA repair ATPase RecN
MQVSEEVRSAIKANGATALDSLGIPALETFPGVREKREAWRAATSRFSECEEKIKRVREERETPPASIQERAEASLRGEKPAPKISAEDRAALFEDRRVLAAAVNIAKNALDEAIAAASVEVCKRLTPEHRLRVKEIANRAIALQEAIEAEANLRQAIQAKGLKVSSSMTECPRCPVTLGRPEAQGSPLNYFLKALRARGVEVGR